MRQPRWSHLGGKSGFSLVEVLVVAAILGVLAALIFPSVKGALKRSQQASCLSNLRQIGVAAHLFAGDHNGLLPGRIYTPASGSTPENNHGGEQWDVQIMPYLGIPTTTSPVNRTTVFYCPASVRNPSFALNRQLSYAWNRMLETNNTQRLANVRAGSSIVLAMDNKILGNQPDLNTATFQSAGNTIYFSNNQGLLSRLPYERHGGTVNLLFIDGSVASRPPVSNTNPTPQRVRFYNDGPLSPGTL